MYVFIHFLINIGMVIGLTPTIGIPLPFLSYGGSSFIAFTILLFESRPKLAPLAIVPVLISSK